MKRMSRTLIAINIGAVIAIFVALMFSVADAAPITAFECGVVDYKPDNRNYARQITANLNVGEPRTVRLIYFLPNDRPYRADVVQRMKDEILNIQSFYAEAMQAHGYDMTFKIETDTQEIPVVHRVNGQHTDSHYVYDTGLTVYDEVKQAFNVWNNIYFIVIDNSVKTVGNGTYLKAQGFGGNYGKNGGTLLLPDEFEYKTAAHELGHAFGLQHDFRSGGYIMSYGAGRNRLPIRGPDQDRLSACNANLLAVHPHFNPNIPTESGQPSTIELISPSTYPTNSESVEIQLKVTHSKGLQQVIIFVYTIGPLSPVGYPEVKACRRLSGEKEAVVAFEYDGNIPSTLFTHLDGSTKHSIRAAAIDTNGDISYKSFTLSEELQQSTLVIKQGTTSMSSMSGGFQQWGLPNGARFYLGKGGVGMSDKAIAFSPDGLYLAVSSGIGIWLYDAKTYKEIALIPTSKTSNSIAFSPDGTLLAYHEMYSTVKLWSITTKQNIATTSFGAKSLAFSPDGNLLASTGGNSIYLWDVVTAQELAPLEYEGTAQNFDSISFSPDGTLIASGGESGRVILWNVETREKITTIRHKSRINSLAFSPNGNIIASASYDSTVKLWDVAKGEEIKTIRERYSVGTVAFSPDGKNLAWTVYQKNFGKIIKLWDMTMGEPDTTTITALNLTNFGINSIAFSPDGKTLATASWGSGLVKVWDVETGNAIDLGHIMLDHNMSKPISFSPNNPIIATGGRDGIARLWDIQTGQHIGNLPAGKPGSWVRLVLFSADGKTIASRASGERITRLWDVKTQTMTGTLDDKSIISWASSPNSPIIATGAVDGTIKLWDIQTKQKIATLEKHAGWVNAIDFSPDGKTLVSVSQKIKLWDLETKQNIATIQHEGSPRVRSVEFSNHESIFASSSWDEVNIWHTTTQTLITSFDRDYWKSGSMAYSHDNTIVLVDFMGAMSIWDVVTQKLLVTFSRFSYDQKTFATINRGVVLLRDTEAIKLTTADPAIVNTINQAETRLLNNYPNPFNPETWIPYRLAEDANVELTIYDTSGHVVRKIDIGHKKAGDYETRNNAIYWDGRNDLGERVASSVYFYHLKAGDYSATKRMLILK